MNVSYQWLHDYVDFDLGDVKRATAEAYAGTHDERNRKQIAETLKQHEQRLGDIDSRDGEGNYLGSISFRDHLAIISFGLQLLPHQKLPRRSTGNCPIGRAGPQTSTLTRLSKFRNYAI